MELQKDFGLVDSTEGEEDEELEQEKIAHQVEGGISLRHYQVMLRQGPRSVSEELFGSWLLILRRVPRPLPR